MRLPSRVLGLALAALAVFGAVVAIGLLRAKPAPVVPAAGSGTSPTPGPPPATSLAATGGPATGTLPRGPGARRDPNRPVRPELSIRIESGALDLSASAWATFTLRLLGADGIERTVASRLWPDGGSSQLSDGADIVAWLRSEGARSDVRLEGLPPGAIRALVIVGNGRDDPLGIGGPISIDAEAKEALLDVVPADRLGTVVADVRRGGMPFGPASLVVRASGLTVDHRTDVRGRAAPVPAPTGTPLEVAILEAPGHGELGLPPSKTLVLAPRQAQDAPFDLDDGVSFAIRALDRTGSPLPFRALVWRDGEGREPRPASGLLLTTGTALEHTGRGPVGDLSVLVIPTHTGAPTWARVPLAGRAVVPIDVRVGLEGGVLDLRLVDEDGAPRALWQVDLVRADASELSAFVSWSGSADLEGHVVTPPLPAGAYLLEVGGRFVRPVTLPAAGLTVSYPVPSVPGSPDAGPVLDVTVSDADGQPRALASAYVRPEEDGWGRRLVPRRDEPGRFVALVLAAGRFRVVAPWTWTAGPRHGPVDVPVTLLGEGTVRLDVRVPPP